MGARAWTQMELNIVKNCWASDPKKVLAALDRTSEGIRKKARLLGLGPKKPIVLSPVDIDLDARLQVAHASVREGQRAINLLKRHLGEALEFRDELMDACRTLPVPKAPPKLPISSKTKSPAVIVSTVSDWHTGEVVLAEETEGFGGYDLGTTERRVEQLGDTIIRYTQAQRHAYRIEKCVVFVLGDMLSGELHDDHRRTNALTIAEQPAVAAGFLAGYLNRLAGIFTSVEVHLIPGNHGRSQAKPPSKLAAISNHEWTMQQILTVMLRDNPRVKISAYKSIMQIVHVGEHRFLIMHGDGVAMYKRTPFYGLENMVNVEARKRLGTDRWFDYVCIGHFHVPADFGGKLFINGCLCGYTEYSQRQSYQHCDASQVAFLLHLKHGIFNRTVVKLT